MKSILLVALFAACALAQFTLPPDVAFVNADAISASGSINFQGQNMPFTATGSFEYTAAQNPSSGPYSMHAKLTVSSGGQQTSGESWLVLTGFGSKTPILDVFGLSDNFCQSAEFGHGGDQNGTISCSKWTPTSASASIYSQTKWAQTCSIDFGAMGVDFTGAAITSNGQLQQLEVTFSGQTMATFTVQVTSQSSNAPAPIQPPNCATSKRFFDLVN